MASKTIDPKTVGILKKGTIENGVYKLPGQLDRADYDRANKVLKDNAAKWDKKLGGHTFGQPGAAERFLASLDSGRTESIQQETQFFATPAPLVARLMELADVRPGMLVLEPSAGTGAIAVPLALAVKANLRVQTCESHPPFQIALQKLGLPCWEADFLAIEPSPAPRFDRVVMNPPFTRGTDVRHVLHARRFLKPDGILVSVTSPGWERNNDKASADFRALVESEGDVYDVPAGTFKESGTNIETRIVVLGGAR